MTDPVQEAVPETVESVESAPTPPVQRRDRTTLVLAVAFIVLVALVAAAPLWAPGLMPLLPWNSPVGGGNSQETQLAARLDRLETAVGGLTKTVTATAAANQSAITALGSAQKAALDVLDRRVVALENEPPPSPPDLSGLQQQMGAATAQIGALGKRVEALEKAAQKPAVAPTEVAAALVVLQIGEAVRVARPFPNEYATLAALVHDLPDLAAAAAPLAGPAKTGVAGGAVLTHQLEALATRIATAEPPPADDIGARIMARLRGLVTIRRIGGTAQTPAEAAVNSAEVAMRRGDLAGAVASLRTLSGANAAAAQAWLNLAEPRLQVEQTLDRLATLLAAHLGKSAAPAAPG
ncbi:MAG TPA: hypothetical protein VND87_01805 [Stellaceae bacterium]|nr:hypothetical protein [Stellaceae bacterium]